MQPKLKYYDNNPNRGIMVDWHFIYNEYLKIVKRVCGDAINEFYLPDLPWNSARWFFELSERSVGKTSNFIIIGLMLFRYYRIKTEYIRLTLDGIAPKNSRTLFDVIRQFGYISLIFNDDYNDVYYDRRGWYLVKVDENGKELSRSSEFMHMHSLESKEVDSEKSVYNSPTGDYIIIDEAIPVNGINTEEQFINMIQLHSTIRRQREVTTIILANTINPYCRWFSEFGICETISKLHKGDRINCKTSLGVEISVHYISFDLQRISEKRLNNNLRYYGFGNTKLNSVTGAGEWQTKLYPHLPSDVREHPRTQLKLPRVIFYLNEKPMVWELWKSDTIGIYAYIRPYYNDPLTDSIVCKLQQPTQFNEFYGIPQNRLGQLIERLLYEKRTFYSHNDIGARFEEYVLQFKSNFKRL